jgi:hypothetical protein
MTSLHSAPSATTRPDASDAGADGVVATVDQTFHAMAQAEATRMTSTSRTSQRKRYEVYSPAADEADVQTYKRLDGKASGLWSAAGALLGLGSMFATGMIYDVGELGSAPAMFGGAGAWWVTVVVAGAALDVRARKRFNRFRRTHADVVINVPERADEASDSFIACAAALQKMDLPDSARAQIADARVVLNRLMVSLSELDAEDIHTSDRLVEEIERLAIEAKVTLDVARRRHDIIKGLDPDALIAAAGSVSLYDAALDIVTEHKHIEQVLDRQS